MPLFVQLDKVSLARKGDKINFDGDKIMSQITVVIQKWSVMYVRQFMFGRNYVILQG